MDTTADSFPIRRVQQDIQRGCIRVNTRHNPSAPSSHDPSAAAAAARARVSARFVIFRTRCCFGEDRDGISGMKRVDGNRLFVRRHQTLPRFPHGREQGLGGRHSQRPHQRNNHGGKETHRALPIYGEHWSVYPCKCECSSPYCRSMAGCAVCPEQLAPLAQIASGQRDHGNLLRDIIGHSSHFRNREHLGEARHMTGPTSMAVKTRP